MTNNLMDRINNIGKTENRIARSAVEYADRIYDRLPKSLDEAYNSYSVYKARAWFGYVLPLIRELNGFRVCISGHNCMKYSVCFQFSHPETGVLMGCYITPDYTRFCEL